MKKLTKRLLSHYPELEIAEWTEYLRIVEGRQFTNWQDSPSMEYRYGVPGNFTNRFFILEGCISFRDFLNSINKKEAVKVICYSSSLFYISDSPDLPKECRYFEMMVEFKNWTVGRVDGNDRDSQFQGWVADQKISGYINFDPENYKLSSCIFDFKNVWRDVPKIRPSLSVEIYEAMTGKRLDQKHWRCV